MHQISPSPPTRTLTDAERPLWTAACQMEAAFLSQMLDAAGLGKPSASFSGGIGEDQFVSLLRDEQARGLVAAGGIGLAESIFRSLIAGVRHD
jgi:flagellar protein FlgJ